MSRVRFAFIVMVLGLLACQATPTPTAVSPTPTTTPLEGAWEEHFYNNTDAQGEHAYTEYVEAWSIDHTWGSNAPVEGVAADRFSVSAYREFVPTEDQTIIDISVFVDDGVRIWVNGRKVLDEWFRGQQGNFHVVEQLRPGESNSILILYFEEDGVAALNTKVSFPPPAKPVATVVADQWLVRYWQIAGDRRVFIRENYEWWHPIVYVGEEQFPGLRLNWSDGGPAGMEPDNFEVSFVRNVTVAGGKYLITLISDNLTRLIIDDKEVFTTADGLQTDVTLAPGMHFIELIFREEEGLAFIEFSWEPAK